MPVFVRILTVFGVSLIVPPAAFGASGEDVYRTRCALCHDSGATQAPRVGQPNDLAATGGERPCRPAALGARGCARYRHVAARRISDLGDNDVAAAVDYMLSTLTLAIPETGNETPAAQRTRFPPGAERLPALRPRQVDLPQLRPRRGVRRRCHLRFDDTNPEKEEQEYVDSILDA
jgi:cytochrome c5